MSDGISVLHVEDDAGFADLTADLLRAEDGRFAVATEHTVADARSRFADETFDCVVSDYDLPHETGLDLLDAVRAVDEDVPFVLFTGKGSEEVASDAFSAGATDYLQKEGGTEQFTLLANRITNAVETVRAKTQRERRLDAIETASEGIAILDDETGEYRYVNEAYADIYGYDPEAFRGEHWSLVYPDDEVGRVTEEILPQVTEEGVWHGRTTGVRADGSTFVEDHTLSLSSSGELICSVRDVTDEQARKQDLERYRTVVQAVGDPVYTVDAEGYFTFVNDAYAALTGYEKETLVGSHVDFVLDDASVERGQAVIRRLLSSETDADQETYEVTIETSDGERITCEDNLSLLPLADGEFRGNAGTIRDITDRKEREYELRRYKQMANAAADMVYVLDDDGRIEFVNDTATDLTGYDRETLIGAHVGLFMDETDVHRGRELIQRLLRPDGPDDGSFEWTLHTADGETIPCESHISLVTDGDRLRSTTGVVRDITDRRERERELERQNERLAEFASIVSHDLRNPLEVAETRLELAREELDSPHFDHMDTALDRMEAIIDDTLTLAREGESVTDPEPVAVGDLARDCWSLVETDAADLAVAEFSVDGDPDRLRRVFENLFRNTVEHGSTSPRSQAPEDAVEHSSTNPASQTRRDAVEHGSTSPRSQAPEDAVEHGSTNPASQTRRDTVEHGSTSPRSQAPEDAAEHGATAAGPEAEVADGGPTAGVDGPGETEPVSVTVAPLPDGDGFSVADDGRGIPDGVEDRVFEGGYSTSADGTGLGLSVVKRIVEAHGWTITVTESESGGARFEVRGVDSLAEP